MDQAQWFDRNWYELKPYLLIAAAVGMVAVFDFATVAQCLAVGLLFLGGTIWVLRANYRRRDKGKRDGAMYEAIYEYWPFFHLAIGALLFSLSNAIWLAAIALALMLRGAVLVYFRLRNRFGTIKPSLGAH